MLSLTTAAQLTSVIAAIGIAINAVEIIVTRRRMLKFFDWHILRTIYPFMIRGKKISLLLDTLFRPPVFLALLALQAGAAVAVPILFEQRMLAATLCIFVLLVHLGLHLRFVYGFDGSDQMQTVVWGGLVAFHATDSPLVQNAAVLFVAAQLILSYLTSGIAKLISPVWRRGLAVGLIMRTKTYGATWLRQAVKQLHLSGPLSWATILFEVLGPLSVLAGPKPTLLFLAAGVLFHLSIAVAMGLNTFLWAFTATFPAVYYASHFLNRFL